MSMKSRNGYPLPPLRNPILDLDMFVAGEAEADEPFLVEQPG